jgi:hypothetical protein
MELEPLHPVQLARFRAMTFQEKMNVAQGLFRMAQRARLEAAKRRHPGLTEDEYRQIVAREFARSHT